MRPFCINCFNHQNLAAIDTYTDWKNIFVTNDVINTTNQYVIYINFNTHIGITTSIIRGYDICLERIIFAIQFKLGPSLLPWI